MDIGGCLVMIRVKCFISIERFIMKKFPRRNGSFFLMLMICISFIFVLVVPRTYAMQKTIHVDLSLQRLYAYQDGQLIYDFPVSTGKLRTPTPTGAFWPWIKLRYTLMQGGSKARGDYYYLPNVPYVIYFYNDNYPKWASYAIHGTYWHNNFGHPMSHGCVNLRTSDMALLYNWIDVVSNDKNGNGSGTVITISGTTPGY